MGDPVFDLRDAVGYVVVQVAEELEHAFTEAMAREGLTVRQFGILTHVALGAGTAAEVARRLNVTAQSVGPQIDTLVARGLVERGTNPGRGRPIAIALTASGREALARAGALAAAEQRRTVGHLSAAERAALVAQLRDIGRRARER